jgi:hypothetical protein
MSRWDKRRRSFSSSKKLSKIASTQYSACEDDGDFYEGWGILTPPIVIEDNGLRGGSDRAVGEVPWVFWFFTSTWFQPSFGP